MSRVEQAAHNNAIWCDSVCRAHGIPGKIQDEFWLNRHSVPRFYPNMVTLSTRHGTAAQLTGIEALMDAGLPDGWGVKDSFCSLDLTAWGFQPLFEARWMWRAPSHSFRSRDASGIQWACVQGAPELEKWETAWNGSATQNPSDQQPCIFLPTMLDDPKIVFIAGYKGSVLVAGAIANCTTDVVGLSNVFVPQGDPVPFWADCVAMAQERFPGVPTVGYERGAELAIVKEVGFELLAPLKVWGRQG